MRTSENSPSTHFVNKHQKGRGSGHPLYGVQPTLTANFLPDFRCKRGDFMHFAQRLGDDRSLACEFMPRIVRPRTEGTEEMRLVGERTLLGPRKGWSPTLLLLLALALFLAGCGCSGSREGSGGAGGGGAKQGGTLTILAASSLTDAFGELGNTFEKQNPATKVKASFGAGSHPVRRRCRRQVEAPQTPRVSLGVATPRVAAFGSPEL
jgi:hypothetical protein